MRRLLPVLLLLVAAPALAAKDPCKDVIRTIDTGFHVSTRAGLDWFGTPWFLFERRDDGWHLLGRYRKPGAQPSTIPAGSTLEAVLVNGRIVAVALEEPVDGVVVGGLSIGTSWSFDVPVSEATVRAFVASPVRGTRVLVGGKEFATERLEDEYGERVQKAAACLLGVPTPR